MRLDNEKPGKELQALGADTAEGAWAGTNPNSLWRCNRWDEHGSLHSSNSVIWTHVPGKLSQGRDLGQDRAAQSGCGMHSPGSRT